MNGLTGVIPLAAGFALDWIFGDPYTLPHPIRWIGTLIAKLEAVLRRRFGAHLRLGGLLLVLTVLTLSAGIPAFLLFFCYRIHYLLGIAVESVLCYYMLAARCLKTESMKVYTAVRNGDVEQARKAVSMIVGRDTAVLDETGIIKAAVETVAENTSDGVTAPICYMMLGGAVLGFFYKAANTMDSMIGYKDEKYLEIGHFAARLDDLLNFIPSRITALYMIVSAFLLGYDGKQAYRIWKRDRLRHESPNSAQTESACAGALGIQLAGDAWYFGKLHKKPCLGDPLRPVENEDIRRANRLMYAASVLMLLTALLIRGAACCLLAGSF